MLYDIIGRAVTKTTRITEPSKIGTTIAAEGKGAIRATVKKTVVDIQRLVKAISNGIRRVAGKAAPLHPKNQLRRKRRKRRKRQKIMNRLGILKRAKRKSVKSRRLRRSKRVVSRAI